MGWWSNPVSTGKQNSLGIPPPERVYSRKRKDCNPEQADMVSHTALKDEEISRREKEGEGQL